VLDGMSPCGRLAVALLALGGWALPAADTDEDLLILVTRTRPLASASSAAVGVVVRPQQDRLYEAVWKHPNQVFADTDRGPMPLFIDVVFDAAGNPQPRFPDYFTYQFIANPSEDSALDYLAAQAARWRRYQEAAEILRLSGFEHGYVKPDDFVVDHTKTDDVANNTAFYNADAIDPGSRGTPFWSPLQAQVRGLDPSRIPATPNGNVSAPVEVLYFWDWRDEPSRTAMAAWAYFADDVRQRELGVRCVGVSLDSDQNRPAGYLEYWKAMGLPCGSFENYGDITDLRASLQLRGAPTYVFLDRRSGRLERLEGIQGREALEAALMRLVRRRPEEYRQARAPWFGRVDPRDTGAAPVLPRSDTPLPPTTFAPLHRTSSDGREVAPIAPAPLAADTALPGVSP
jgi:hypothetical protein